MAKVRRIYALARSLGRPVSTGLLSQNHAEAALTVAAYRSARLKDFEYSPHIILAGALHILALYTDYGESIDPDGVKDMASLWLMEAVR